jgi:hypothetical protein
MMRRSATHSRIQSIAGQSAALVNCDDSGATWPTEEAQAQREGAAGKPANKCITLGPQIRLRTASSRTDLYDPFVGLQEYGEPLAFFADWILLNEPPRHTPIRVMCASPRGASHATSA